MWLPDTMGMLVASKTKPDVWLTGIKSDLIRCDIGYSWELIAILSWIGLSTKKP